MVTTFQAVRRSDELLRVLSRYDRVTVVMHDNPDPDAIATGWAVALLVEERLGRPVELVGGGAIVRAENRYMVELLNPPIQLVDTLEPDDRVAVVLVDCSVGTSNHLVTRQAIRPVAVIDHHVNGNSNEGVAFVDLRPDVAATATIAATYLREQELEPGVKLATAMLYAIRTETCGMESYHTLLDRECLVWLTERAEPSLLAEFDSAPLSREYFRDLALALQATTVYGDSAFCLLPHAEGAEIVGELADLIIRCQGIRRVLSGAVLDSGLIVSVRTINDDDIAASLVQRVLEGLGSGGGHAHRAGGKVSTLDRSLQEIAAIKNQLCQRWLQLCGVHECDGQPLIARHDILTNL